MHGFKMAGNFESATNFVTSRGRLEKHKQQNEYSNKDKKTHQLELLQKV